MQEDADGRVNTLLLCSGRQRQPPKINAFCCANSSSVSTPAALSSPSRRRGGQRHRLPGVSVFVPVLLFVTGLAAIVADLTKVADVDTAVGVSGGLGAQVRAAFAHHPDGRWIATLLGLWGLAVAGRSLSRILFTASAVAWRLPTTDRPPLKVLGSIAGFVFVIGLVVVLINRVRIELGFGLAGLSFLPALAIYTVPWLGVLFFLPRSTDDPGVLLLGSALIGVTIAAMKSVSQFYLPGHLARAGELYGTIGTTVVTLA